MEVKYVCPFWGSALTPAPSSQAARGTALHENERQTPAPDFINKVIDSGYDGIEIDIPPTAEFEKELLTGIEAVRKERDLFSLHSNGCHRPLKVLKNTAINL